MIRPKIYNHLNKPYTKNNRYNNFNQDNNNVNRQFLTPQPNHNQLPSIRPQSHIVNKRNNNVNIKDENSTRLNFDRYLTKYNPSNKYIYDKCKQGHMKDIRLINLFNEITKQQKLGNDHFYIIGLSVDKYKAQNNVVCDCHLFWTVNTFKDYLMERDKFVVTLYNKKFKFGSIKLGAYRIDL